MKTDKTVVSNFEEISIKNGNIEKRLEGKKAIVQATSKELYFGVHGNWKIPWKKVQELSFTQASNSVYVVSQKNTFECKHGSKHQWAEFQTFLQRQWNKQQTKRRSNNDDNGATTSKTTTTKQTGRTRTPQRRYGGTGPRRTFSSVTSRSFLNKIRETKFTEQWLDSHDNVDEIDDDQVFNRKRRQRDPLPPPINSLDSDPATSATPDLESTSDNEIQSDRYGVNVNDNDSIGGQDSAEQTATHVQETPSPVQPSRANKRRRKIQRKTYASDESDDEHFFQPTTLVTSFDNKHVVSPNLDHHSTPNKSIPIDTPQTPDSTPRHKGLQIITSFFNSTKTPGENSDFDNKTDQHDYQLLPTSNPHVATEMETETDSTNINKNHAIDNDDGSDDEDNNSVAATIDFPSAATATTKANTPVKNKPAKAKKNIFGAKQKHASFFAPRKSSKLASGTKATPALLSHQEEDLIQHDTQSTTSDTNENKPSPVPKEPIRCHLKNNNSQSKSMSQSKLFGQHTNFFSTQHVEDEDPIVDDIQEPEDEDPIVDDDSTPPSQISPSEKSQVRKVRKPRLTYGKAPSSWHDGEPREKKTSSSTTADLALFGSSSVRNMVTRPEITKNNVTSRTRRLWRGLRNLGNTCYMNASLQMLCTFTKFIDALSGYKSPLVSPLLSLARDLKSTSSISTVDPWRVKAAVDKTTDRFEGCEQRDAHEFLGHLIDEVHEELGKSSKHNKESNPTHGDDGDDVTYEDSGNSRNEHCATPTDLFQTKVQVCLTCKSCGYTRNLQEIYRHISLDLINKYDDNEEKSTTLDVQTCLNQFFQPEDREIKCEKCDSGTEATQAIKIISKPKALIIHLKRFSVIEKPAIRPIYGPPQTVKEMVIRKNKAPVGLCEKLTLDGFAKQSSTSKQSPKQYTIKSIVHHIGSTANSGHYTAHAEREEKVGDGLPVNKWLAFDDGIVTPAKREYVLRSERYQSTAYMLLYVAD